MSTSNVTFIKTPTSVAVRINGEFKSLLREHPLFGRLIDALETRAFHLIEGLFDAAKLVKQHSSGKFWVDDKNCIIHKGEVMPPSLSKRIMAFCEQGIDTESLVKFWENLVSNPSLRSREHLYAFLDHNNIPLTEDGCFVAYKYINANWTDCHSGTFDNSIGATPSMPREEVDEDPTVTCSRGLHVCAYGYLYGGDNLRHVEVKVHPADVVCVPNDYSGQKMRTCKYTVIREMEKGTGGRKEQLYPKFKEGQQVECQMADGIVVGTVDEIHTSPTTMNEYTISLEDGNVVRLQETKVSLLDLSDSIENADESDIDDDEDFDDDDDDFVDHDDDDDEDLDDDEDEYEDIDEDDVEDIEDEQTNARLSKLEAGQTRLEKKLDDGISQIKKAIDDAN